jgi:transglutaminase-like putative cysteine protease
MQHVPAGTDPDGGDDYLRPTRFFDCDHPRIRAFAEAAIAGTTTDAERAVRLFYRVRDGWLYDPFSVRLTQQAHTASVILAQPGAYCIPKAVLLVAAARAVGIPSGIGLADVTNHLTSERLTRMMGGNTLFVDHGYAVLRVDGKWLKAAPAFNRELCDRFGVTPTEFDGRHDAILQEFDAKGRRHMQYKAYHGTWSDLPFEKIDRDLRTAYAGSELIRQADAIEAAETGNNGGDEFDAPRSQRAHGR